MKLEPIVVSRPIGRISVVTIEKMPSITETTASHPTRGDRVGNPGPPGVCVVGLVVEAMISIR
ncbi:ABC-type transporter, periplasmic subunit [Streptomyces laurentii]|uniref:ABC-type transporter, periplasmic subunit n=1 Tax=Streptomyces laurentii TaxID=39478 RepID=A0A160P530_STRLU|nr:ABC-type transporter, periplasmic subunit [Streptomyces laurentii]